MKKLLALLLALWLPLGTLAEMAPVPSWQGSLLHLLTEEQLTMLAALPSEEVHAMVEALFTAAAGVTEREELALWKNLKTQSARDERSAENAAYRARTLPWLMLAFAPGNRLSDGVESSVPEESVFPALADSMETLRGNPQGQAYLALAASYGAADAEGCMAVTQAVVQRWLAEIDHEQLAGINGDYQFWLYGAGTPIDYPVVQCGNNSYYMDRMFNRKANKAGTLFVDYRNLPDFADPNTLIYGHHMRDSSMFHSLTDYESRGFYEAHPWMLAVQEDEILLIEIFAGYVTDGRDHCYDIALSDETDMREFVAAVKEKSNFDAHVEIDCARDHLVTLSTCAYNFENARYVVIGRLVTMWEGK